MSGPFLRGTIISRYENEPIAHMVLAEKLFRDIEENGIGEGVSVSLPKIVE